MAFGEIEAAMSEDRGELSATVRDGTAADVPVGCAALLAQKLGASDMRTVAAAGLAGGIGLSGSACGALGAAIWLASLKSLEEGAKKVPYKPASAQVLLERFLKCTGGEIKCSKIVGRTFDGVVEHAAFICEGGCAEIIDTLAAGSAGVKAVSSAAERGDL